MYLLEDIYMSCKFCDKTNADIIRAKMFIERPNGKTLTEKANAFISRTDKGDTKLVIDGFWGGFGSEDDSIDRVEFHIRFCPLCGKKIGS